MALSTQLVVFAMRLLSLSFSIFRLATSFFFFFFNDTATTEIYTLSLHDALPIYLEVREHLQEERLELWLGLVDLVDEEDDRRVRQDRLEQRARRQEPEGKERVLLPGDLGDGVGQ